MINYNTDFLVKVQTNNFCKSDWYTYHSEKKKIGFFTIKDGIYAFGSYLGNKVPKYHSLKDGVIYKKPECILYYADGSKVTYYFDSHTDAVEFGAKFTVGEKWI